VILFHIKFRNTIFRRNNSEKAATIIICHSREGGNPISGKNQE